MRKSMKILSRNYTIKSDIDHVFHCFTDFNFQKNEYNST